MLAVIAAEAGWLIARAGWSVRATVLRLMPGVLMLVALRAALTGLDWIWIAMPLALSFPVHLLDLRRQD